MNVATRLARKRRVIAPASAPLPQPDALLAVTVDDDEDVEWIWTYHADGSRTVSGYHIRLRLQDLESILKSSSCSR